MPCPPVQFFKHSPVHIHVHVHVGVHVVVVVIVIVVVVLNGVDDADGDT